VRTGQRPARGSLCGTVAVPENRTLKGSRQIALNVVVLPARSGNGHDNPIFGSAGGPGIGSTRLAIRYPRLYDTRVALECLGRHESNVRAIAVSGVFSPADRIGVQGPTESQHALQQLFAMCAADTACNGAFQNVAAELDAVLTRLDKSPATATIPLTTASAPLAVTISRGVRASALSAAALPRGFDGAAARDSSCRGERFRAVRHAGPRARSEPDPIADGMALSVTCAQGASFTTPAIAAAARGTFLRADRAQYLSRACAVWPTRRRTRSRRPLSARRLRRFSSLARSIRSRRRNTRQTSPRRCPTASTSSSPTWRTWLRIRASTVWLLRS
jgi:hypothetical protein